MNAPQLGKVRTCCRDCVFAEYEELTQVGCKLGRIETFRSQDRLVEARDDSKEFFVINGFCNSFRNKEWAASKSNTIFSVREETDITLGLVIYDEPSGDISKIGEAIESIKVLDYPHRRIKVVISSYVNRGVVYLMNKVEQLKDLGFHCEAVINAPLDKQTLDYDAFHKCYGCSYFGKMEHDSIIDPDLLNRINRSLNEDLEKIILFENNGVSILPFGIVNREYPNHNDFHKIVDYIRPFAQQNNMYVSV